MLKFSAVLACLTGVILAGAGIVLNWGTSLLLLATFVLVGVWGTLRGASLGPFLLIFGWGVTFGVAWMAGISSVPHIKNLQNMEEIVHYLELTLMGIAFIGFLTATFGMRRGE